MGNVNRAVSSFPIFPGSAAWAAALKYIYIYPMCVPIIVGHSPIPVYPLFRSHYISPFEATSVMAANKEEDPLARAWLEVFPVQKWKSWGILVKKTNPKFGKFLGNFGNSLDVMFLYVF
jgi:hypothetical protein